MRERAAFIVDSATFKFDAITSTLKALDVTELESYPVQYVVRLEFQCLHSGYGDRTGHILLQVITPHTAVVKVVNGAVVSAVIDDSWDEIWQKPIQNNARAIYRLKQMINLVLG